LISSRILGAGIGSFGHSWPMASCAERDATTITTTALQYVMSGFNLDAVDVRRILLAK
jgi:hypothetical protein